MEDPFSVFLHKKYMTTPPFKIVALPFATVELYNKFVVVTIKEGVLFDQPELEALYEIFDTFYPNNSFGYISNRQNKYTINPTSYIETSKYPRLVGMAIVCTLESNKRMALYEKTFYEKPFEIFEGIEKAQEWIDKILVYNNFETVK